MIDKEYLINLIRDDENPKVEFKRSEYIKGHKNCELAKAMAGLANHEGGKILIGVKNDRTIEGFSCNESEVKTYEHLVYNIAADNCDPPITPEFSVVSLEEGTVFVIDIPKKIGIPVRANGKFYIRHGNRTRELTHEELQNRYINSEDKGKEPIDESQTISFDKLSKGQFETIIVPIDGKETKIELRQIEINKLELDELNPRISFFRDNQVTDTLTEDQIIFALTNKKPEAFRKLKDSIHNNKGIVYPIWIEPLKSEENKKYKVIEGNTRVVVYRQLQIEEPYEDRWKTILSNVLPHEIDEEQKNFIRLQSHLRGTTEWDAYEKAKYLYKLWHDDGWSVNRLEKQTKMTEKQIEANIEAYRLMEEQYLPAHSDDPNEVSKFSYFVEYVKDKKLQNLMKKNLTNIKDFCDWIADKEKIPTGRDVRRLRDIFDNQDSKNAFIDKGFNAAMQILELKKPHLVSSFYKDIENVIEELKEINTQELDEIINEENSEKEKKIRDLAKWSQTVVKIIEKGKNAIGRT